MGFSELSWSPFSLDSKCRFENPYFGVNKAEKCASSSSHTAVLLGLIHRQLWIHLLQLESSSCACWDHSSAFQHSDVQKQDLGTAW